MFIAHDQTNGNLGQESSGGLGKEEDRPQCPRVDIASCYVLLAMRNLMKSKRTTLKITAVFLIFKISILVKIK